MKPSNAKGASGLRNSLCRKGFALFVCASVLTGCVCAPSATPQAGTTQAGMTQEAQPSLEEINRARQALGLPPQAGLDEPEATR
jgi:hypothetical protein